MAMTDPTAPTTDPGRIFVDASAYADFDNWHRVATEIRNTTPVRRVEVEPRRGARRSGDLRCAYFSIDRARHELGWEPSVPLREGLAQTVATLR